MALGCSQIDDEKTSEPEKCTLTYNANGGSGEMKSVTANEGSEITLAENTFTKNGYTFAGWNTTADGKGEKIADKAKIKLTANTTLYAQWTASDYKITYNLDGGTNAEGNPDGYNAETETITLQSPTKTGYAFAGWYKDSKFENKATEIANGSTGDVTLYAKWEVINYTVTFDKNADDATGDVPAEIQVTYDVEFALPKNAFTKIGYNFAGWNTKADGSGNSFADKANVKNLTTENGETVTLYAQWADRGTHKINYVLNDGNHSGTPTTSFKETEDVTLGTAERTGYTFIGWYETENFSGTAVTSWKAGEKTEDVTLYAKWTANNYTVTFDKNANGVTGTMESQTFTYGTPQALSGNTFTRTGYEFAGWATSADGEVTYNDKQDYSISAENVTLYAKWTAINYTITYELDGGTNADDNPESYTIEDLITLEAPTKNGYSFGGWYEAKNFSGTAVASWKTGEKTEDVTLYAKWTANNYTVKFNKNADDATGDVPADIQTTYDKEFELPENTFTKIGYNFAGWNTEADGNGTDYEANTKVKNLTAENNATVTLYAKWEAIEYKITYENTENATNDNPESYTIEDSITLKEPTKDDYTFDEWYTNNSFTEESKVTEIKKGSIGERTLYAKWTANNYTVSFDANGGTGSMTPQIFTYGTSQALSENTFTRTDYDFVGWATSANGNVTYKDSQDYSISAENVTLYAIWRDIISFKKIPAVSITGSETWNPASNVFVSGRVLDIKAFWMSDHEVTQAEWTDVMGSAPSDMAPADGNAYNNPVNYVSWYDAIVYCNKRSIKEGLTPCYTINGFTNPDDWGDVPPMMTSNYTWNAAICDFEATGYRLPTEAEWEWAARDKENYTYAGSNDKNEVAWYSSNSSSKTHEVKTKKSNGYELYDMSGNVNEWCWDWYSSSISTDTPATGVSYLKPLRCIRGGSFLSGGIRLENIAYRLSDHLGDRMETIGFRVVRTAE